MNAASAPALHTLSDIEVFERVPLSERITRWTVPNVLEQGASIAPDAPALHFLQDAGPAETPCTVTFKELLARGRQAANALWRLWGGRPGVVGILLPLVPENYYLICGGTAAGILCPVNSALSPARIAGVLNAAGADVLITLGPTPGFDIWETARQALASTPGIRTVLQVRGPGGTVDPDKDFARLLQAEPGEHLTFARPLAAPDTAIYCPTGGTTGAPKLARITHGGIAYKCHAFRWVLGHGPGDVIPAGLPLFHVGGIVSRTLSPLSSGVCNVVVSPHGFRAPSSRKNYWKLVERYRITEPVAPPTLLGALLNEPIGDCDLSSLKPFANTGSAGLPIAVARAFAERGIQLLGNYGLTEYTASAALSTRVAGHPAGSSGIRLPYTAIKTVILDAQGREARDAAPGEPGVIAIRGPGAIPGYVDPSADATLFFRDGWINTGDIGRLDDAGRLWITGRVKDLIIRGGHNIDASAIENALMEYPGVQYAAAVGKPDAYAGELPVAYVQARAGARLDAEAIRQYARGAVTERGAAPTDIYLTDHMPMTEVGKIFKVALRADAAARVLEEELAFVRETGATLAIEMDHASANGLQADIAIEIPAAGAIDKAALTERIQAALDRYTLPYRLRFTQAPGPDDVYLRYLAAGEFRIQQCQACATHVFYPRLLCPGCGSDRLGWIAASGRGTVHSTTSMRRKPDAGGDYNVSLIDLEEGPRLMSRVEGIAPGAVRIGMRVRARIATEADGPLIVFDATETGNENQ